MSTREGWILYPLVFLCLMQSFKTRWNASTSAEFQQIICRQIVVKNDAGKDAILLHCPARSGEGGSGAVEVYDQKQQLGVALRAANAQGDSGTASVTVVGANQQPVIGLLASHREVDKDSLGSGTIVVFGENRRPAVAMHAASRLENEPLGYGAVEVFGGDGNQAVALRAAPGGGLIFARRDDGAYLALGHDRRSRLSGVFASEPNQRTRLVPLLIREGQATIPIPEKQPPDNKPEPSDSSQEKSPPPADPSPKDAPNENPSDAASSSD